MIRRTSLGFLCYLILAAMPLPAQILITSLYPEPGGDVQIYRSGSFDPETASTQSNALYPGDQLWNPSEDAAVDLQCPDGSTEKLSGSFRIVILPPTEEKVQCSYLVLGGEVQVQGDTPTELQSGETLLGSRRTQYGMRVWRTENGPESEVQVYEGEVDVRYSNQEARTIPAGFKLFAVGTQTLESKELDEKDRAQVADLYARLEAAGAGASSFKESYKKLRELHEAVLLDPKDPDRRLSLAIAQVNVGVRNTSPVYQLEKADANSSRADQKAMIMVTRSLAYDRLGKKELARTQFAEAQSLDPQVFVNAGRYDLRLSQAKFLETKDLGRVLYGQGIGALEAGRPDAAIDALHQAAKYVDEKSQQADLYRGLAEAYSKQDKLDEAIAATNRALELAPDDQQNKQLMIDLLRRSGRDDEVKNYMNRVPKNDIENRLQQTEKEDRSKERDALQKGIAALKEKDTATAIKMFNFAIEIDPNVAEAYYYRGVAYANSGRNAEAKSDLVKYLEMAKPGSKLEVQAKKLLSSIERRK